MFVFPDEILSKSVFVHFAFALPTTVYNIN